MQKLVLAWTLLVITAQGLRTHSDSFAAEEQSEESATQIRPWQALMALLLAYSPSPSQGSAFHTGGLSGAVGKVSGVPAVSGAHVPAVGDLAAASVLGSNHEVSRGGEPKMQVEPGDWPEPSQREFDRENLARQIFIPGAQVRVLYAREGFEWLRNQIGTVTGYVQSFEFDHVVESNVVTVRFSNGETYELAPDQLGLVQNGEAGRQGWWNPEEQAYRGQPQRVSHYDRQRGHRSDRLNPGYGETRDIYNSYGIKTNTRTPLSDNAEYHRMRRAGMRNPWQRGGYYVRNRMNQGYGNYQGYGMNQYNGPWYTRGSMEGYGMNGRYGMNQYNGPWYDRGSMEGYDRYNGPYRTSNFNYYSRLRQGDYDSDYGSNSGYGPLGWHGER